MNRAIMLAISLAFLAISGCTARTKIVKHPCEEFDGLRFYRSKPYLLIKPAISNHADGKVDISVEYLPDFAEEYGIQIRAGVGTNDTSVTLNEQGVLTNLNVDVDSQSDENIKAVAGALPSLISAADRGAPSSFTVDAANVPLGFYESVIGRDDCGRKQLYGWRYIGFAPFNPCPTVSGGGPACVRCDDGSLDLWGLVYEDKMMKFKRIGAIAEQKPKSRESASVLP